jgi:hypothetical protein
MTEFDDEAYARQLQDEERAYLEAMETLEREMRQQEMQQQQQQQEEQQRHIPAVSPPQLQPNVWAAPAGKTKLEQEEEDANLARMLSEMGYSMRNFDIQPSEPATPHAPPKYNPPQSGYPTNFPDQPVSHSDYQHEHDMRRMVASSTPRSMQEYEMPTHNPPQSRYPTNFPDRSAYNPPQSGYPTNFPDQSAYNPPLPGYPTNIPDQSASHSDYHHGHDRRGMVASSTPRSMQEYEMTTQPPAYYPMPISPYAVQASLHAVQPPPSYSPRPPPSCSTQPYAMRPAQPQPHRAPVSPFPGQNGRAGAAAASPPDFDPSPLSRGPLDGTLMSPGRAPKGRIQNPFPRQAPVDSAIDLLPGDACLDVPAPAKKKDKKGLFGFMKGKGQKKDDKQDQRSSGSKSVPENAKTASAGIGNDVRAVAFPIPEPVARPAHTIGARPGPLLYSLSVSRDAPDLQEETVGKRPQMGLGRNTGTCAVCRQPAQNPLSALNKKYHPECFRCITCHDQIDPTQPFAFVENNGDKQPMHRKCYAELYGIKCAVCKQSIPAGSDGKVSFVKHPFFDTEQMCPHHARNRTRRCTGCHRFEPEDDPFADLNDVGRCVCLACCRSVVVDSDDAQPLWAKVIDFFENKLNMPIWTDLRKVPILVVGYDALNDHMTSTGNVHGGASQIMTRGLCLTEHQSGRRLKMQRMKFNKASVAFVASDAEDRGFTYYQVPDARKTNPEASVTAILCLSGLPRDLTASVLAHEATHAWIKLHPNFDIQRPIPPQVEEGCAQLIALLFLSDGLEPPSELESNDGSGPSDEKLRQYFKYSIETDDHEIYGMGYRRAAMAYSHIGIEALMSHIVLYQDFPET